MENGLQKRAPANQHRKRTWFSRESTRIRTNILSKIRDHSPAKGLVQEQLSVQRVASRGTEAGVADHAAQLFFRGAVGDAGGADHIFFEHHRAHVIAAETQAELA